MRQNLNTRYFKIHYTGFTSGESKGLHYLRLITRDHIFYTDKRYFQDRSLFQRLKIGNSIYVGTHQLKNGSYWIHWITDGEVMLEPKHPESSWVMLALSTIICALTGYTSIAITSLPHWCWGVSFMIAICSLSMTFLNLGKLIRSDTVRRHPGMRELLVKMNSAKKSDYAFCQPTQEVQLTQQQKFISLPDETLPARFATINGKIIYAEFKEWSKGSGKYRRDYEGVFFHCNKTALLLSWRKAGEKYFIAPILRDNLPPFLSEGDEVSVIYDKNDQSVLALYHSTCNTIFMKNNEYYVSDRSLILLYKLFIGIPLMPLLTTPFLYLHQIDSLANWDWWKFGNGLLAMFIGGLIVVCMFLALTEFVTFIFRLFSSRIDDWIKVRDAVNQFKSSCGKELWIEVIL